MPGRKKTEPEGTGLSGVIANLEKKFGSNAVIRMGDNPELGKSVEVIPTKVAGIDIALGRGGLPKGRIVEIYGPESSGKTSLALRIIAEAQKLGGVCGFIDAEHALDPEYAADIGVNVDDLLLAQPDSGEHALEITNALVKSGEISVLVVDSVAALTPKSELEGEIGDANVGKQARLMSQALRMMTPEVGKTGTILIFINQLREKIGVMFGSPETTTGGKSLKFYSSVRIDIRGTENIGDKENPIGKKTKIKVVKNKVAPPFRVAEVETYYGKGISVAESLVTEASKLNLIKKSGAWFEYEGKNYQGKTSLIEYFENNSEEAEKLYDVIMDSALPKREIVDPQANKEAQEEEPEEVKESDEDSIFD